MKNVSFSVNHLRLVAHLVYNSDQLDCAQVSYETSGQKYENRPQINHPILHLI